MLKTVADPCYSVRIKDSYDPHAKKRSGRLNETWPKLGQACRLNLNVVNVHRNEII